MIENNKRFRFGLGADGMFGSLSFKVERNQADVYLVCRELPQFKHSLHGSGIHRFAESVSAPRKPIESTELLRLDEGQFWTVLRVIFTVEPGYEDRYGLARGPNFLMQPPSASNLQMLSLGFTPHHPSENADTDFPSNEATMKIEDGKHLTATSNFLSIDRFAGDIITHHAPHARTTPIVQYRPSPSVVGHSDALVIFRTKLNTYMCWAHHGIPDADRAIWRARHPISQQLHQAYQFSLAGISIGSDLTTSLSQRAPDWAEQVRKIRGR